MSVNDNLKTVRNIYEAFNKRDFDSALKDVERNAEIVIVPENSTLKGLDGFRQYMQTWVDAFPDARCEVTNIAAGEDWAVAEFRGTGTHKGALRSPEGDLSPTGKRVDLPFCEVHKLKNGKIVQTHAYFDLASMLKQLGVARELKTH